MMMMMMICYSVLLVNQLAGPLQKRQFAFRELGVAVGRGASACRRQSFCPAQKFSQKGGALLASAVKERAPDRSGTSAMPRAFYLTPRELNGTASGAKKTLTPEERS
ncbi:hypothetical protein PDJAM_G00034400 [Pangasius djambal]|uniref:Uncharacterized protein n=1 Tax=Pangasius djambal TaxID=1691987 RepID=A0ACC5YRF9_9TELE|nr:hypothetical protein [Pangasius djambal]